MKKLIAILLAVIIGASVSVNAFAASAKTTYVSDLITVTAESEEKAKLLLSREGYRLLENGNLNSTLKTGVYLGYKETENPDEALTDIAAMNMTGKFSYSDYKLIMEQNKEEIKETIDSFEPVIAEFQYNYKNNKPAALAAYEAMNAFKDDDSGKLMGDYLVDYDYSAAANKKMTETFMQANTQYILTIMEQASIAGGDKDETAIDKLVETGPDGITAKFKGLYPSVAKANQAMAAKYGVAAQEILNEWDSVYDYITEAENSLVKINSNGEIQPAEDFFKDESTEIKENVSDKVKKAVEGMSDAADMAQTALEFTDYSLYNLLSITEYGDETLLDFFNRDKSEVKKEELYPLVDALSEGQRAQLGNNGLKLTLESAFTNFESEDIKDSQAAAPADTVAEVVKQFGVTSIFDGVDRSVFEEGVAFTSAATEHEKLTGESWIAKLSGAENDKDAWLKAIIITSAVTGVLAATCIGSALVARMKEVSKRAWEAADAELREMQHFAAGNTMYFRDFAQLDAFYKVNDISVMTPEFGAVHDELYANEDKALKTYESWKNSKVCDYAQVVKCVSFVLLVAALALDVYFIVEYFSTPGAVEEAIPHHIMTTAVTPYGEDYVYYRAVKTADGKASDTNNHEADKEIGWLVLYVTGDKAAGNPILVSGLKMQAGSNNFSQGSSFVHLFNETGAVNLTAEKYTGAADKANGTYILFTHEASALVGSAITNGTAAIIGVGGLAVGTVLGALLAKLAGKKKKASSSAA